MVSIQIKFQRQTPVQKILLKTLFLCFFPIFSLFMSCSHVKPYYRDSAPPPEAIPPTEENLQYRLLLIGDTGESQENDPVLQKLEFWASQIPEKTMIIFLGDNIYPDGMPEESHPSRREAERRLSAQVDTIKNSKTQGFFIAGNHDWNQGQAGLIREENFIKKKLGKNDVFLPSPGCPGPAKIDVAGLRIIVLDTMFWLSTHLRPNDTCIHKSMEGAAKELKDLVTTANHRLIILITHHPLDTRGVHGGFYTFKDHLFPLTHINKWLWIPLPIVGSLYPILRWNVRKHPQELNSSEYKSMIAQFEDIFSVKKALINASGHDHSLQVLEGGQGVSYILVSGAGTMTKSTPVGHTKNTLFAHQYGGFMAVDFLEDGTIWLRVIEPGDHEVVFVKKISKN
jgi:hypothetical protein